jgi:protein-tyrosine-phosphatase
MRRPIGPAPDIEPREHVVLFVCLHSMGMSRLAAAFLDRVAPAGWRAVSAGIQPGATPSPTASRLLAETPAAAYLDRSAPRAVAAVAGAERVIALRNPSIQLDLPGAEMWDLAAEEFDEDLRDEIRGRAERLAGEVPGA